MERIQSALEAYRHFDPAGWIAVFRVIPAWAGLLSIALGLLMMLFGGRHLFRLVAGPLGALLATVWAATLAGRLGLKSNLPQISLAATLGLFIGGLVWPPFVIFFLFGVPAGLIGGQLAGPDDWLLGFGPCFFLGGAAGVALHKLVGSVVSAAAGAWLVVLGLLASLNPWVPAVDWLAQRPLGVLTIAACFASAGAIFQLFVRPSEEVAAKRKAEKALAKRKAKERAASEKRWEEAQSGKK